MNKNVYYVYIYLDPRKPGSYKYGDYNFDYEPFYVGKGKDNRYLIHLDNPRTNNLLKFRKLNKLKFEKLQPIIQKVQESLSEIDSFQLEMDLINLIGRRDLNRGSLVNLTNGGEGSSERSVSEETRKKIKENHADFKGSNHPKFGKKHSLETRFKLSEAGKKRKHPLEVKQKIGISLVGKVRSLEFRRKISQAKTGNKNWLGKKHSFETIQKMKLAWIIRKSRSQINNL